MNYPMTPMIENNKDKIILLFNEIAKIFSDYSKINFKAMCKMHSMGFNGFKRWHRIRSKQFYKLTICLANELFDVFRKEASFEDFQVTYNVTSMDMHLRTWDSFLEDSISKLGDLNKQFYNETGYECKLICFALERMKYDHEKVGRYYKRFSESDWLNFDMHFVDDNIHEKMKRKEEKHD